MLVGQTHTGTNTSGQDQRHGALTAVQVVILGALQEYFAGRGIHERPKHEINDRAVTHLCRTKSGAEHAGFGDRRIKDTIRAEDINQPFGMWKNRATNILTNQEDLRCKLL